MVLIATRHDAHAAQAIRALDAGRDVFLEKPAALDLEQLTALGESVKRSPGRFMVGFNRRFAPFAVGARDAFKGRRAGLVMVARVNAGRIPPGSWVTDRAEGGGRILGEACHFIDLMSLLGAARRSSACERPRHRAEGGGWDQRDDNVMLTLVVRRRQHRHARLHGDGRSERQQRALRNLQRRESRRLGQLANAVGDGARQDEHDARPTRRQGARRRAPRVRRGVRQTAPEPDRMGQHRGDDPRDVRGGAVVARGGLYRSLTIARRAHPSRDRVACYIDPMRFLPGGALAVFACFVVACGGGSSSGDSSMNDESDAAADVATTMLDGSAHDASAVDASVVDATAHDASMLLDAARPATPALPRRPRCAAAGRELRRSDAHGSAHRPDLLPERSDAGADRAVSRRPRRVVVLACRDRRVRGRRADDRSVDRRHRHAAADDHRRSDQSVARELSRRNARGVARHRVEQHLHGVLPDLHVDQLHERLAGRDVVHADRRLPRRVGSGRLRRRRAAVRVRRHPAVRAVRNARRHRRRDRRRLARSGRIGDRSVPVHEAGLLHRRRASHRLGLHAARRGRRHVRLRAAVGPTARRQLPRAADLVEPRCDGGRRPLCACPPERGVLQRRPGADGDGPARRSRGRTIRRSASRSRPARARR